MFNLVSDEFRVATNGYDFVVQRWGYPWWTLWMYPRWINHKEWSGNDASGYIVIKYKTAKEACQKIERIVNEEAREEKSKVVATLPYDKVAP